MLWLRRRPAPKRGKSCGAGSGWFRICSIILLTVALSGRCRCRSFKRRPNSSRPPRGTWPGSGRRSALPTSPRSGPTSGVLAPGADEVSASIAALFDAHSQVYQALSAQAAAFHSQFVQLMNGGAAQYAVRRGRQHLALADRGGPGVDGCAGTGGERRCRGYVPRRPRPRDPWRRRSRRPRRAATPAPAGTPVAAAPAGSATLASATTPAGAARVVTPAYAPASSPAPPLPPTASAATPAGTPAAAPQTEVPPQTSAAPTMPVSARNAPHAPAAAQPATRRRGTPVKRVPIVPADPCRQPGAVCAYRDSPRLRER